MTTPAENIMARLEGVKPAGIGKWSARCPAHDDRHASLSVSGGDDGRALVHCHAGCTRDTILGALSMRASDLFPPKTPAAHRPATGTAATARRFDLPCLAAKSIAQQVGGTLAGWWPYFGTDDGEALTVLRFDLSDGDKTYRPICPSNGGWSIGDPRGPLPPYRLVGLSGAARVYVLEGEKCADAAAGLGLAATTSAHGAKSAAKTDWTPLAGRDVVILPDNDANGETYAADVARILTGLTPPATVRIVRLPDLPPKGDVVDFLDARDAQAPADLRREIEALADDAPPWTPSAHDATAPVQWHPFPVACLPPACRRYVQELSQAVGADPSFAALALLATMAGAIGNTRRISIKRDWQAPAVIWAVLVGESGTLKTVVLKHVLAPVYRRQADALKTHRAATDQYRAELMAYRQDVKVREKSSRAGGKPPPVEPQPPVLERFVVSDTTVEALADRLQDNPRGLLLARDELSGWVGSFNQYKNVRGADEARWVTMFDASNLLVDRKTGDTVTVFVPSAAVSIVGGIQPGILRRMLTAEYQESCLAARLLMVMPPRRAKRWTERELPASEERRLADLCANLWKLTADVDDNGEPRPRNLPLAADARSVFAVFVTAHGQEAAELTGSMAAARAKLESYAARLALVIQLARWAENPEGNGSGPSEVSAESVRAALGVVEWAKQETRRVYAMLTEGEGGQEAREILDLVARRGGKITARDLCKAMLKRFPTSDDAELYLRGLVRAGVGAWQDRGTGPQGGRPTRDFVLTQGELPTGMDKTHNLTEP